AKKLGSTHEQPLNYKERAWARRAQVQRLILEGKSYKLVMAILQTDFSTVNRDVCAIYKSNGVCGRKGLARKLGIELRTDEDKRSNQSAKKSETEAPPGGRRCGLPRRWG